MFAGAAREAVFSKPEVVRRIRADFIPVALKAGAVMNPPNNLEGKLYREIARSRPAPQGICVANSAGKVLSWVLMFEKNESVLAFLDHAVKRYKAFPDAKKPVAAERFRQFPSTKLPDVQDSGKVIRVPDNARCQVLPNLKKGTLVGRIMGRALDKAGKFVKDVKAQEHYVEARVEVPVRLQEALARAAKEAGKKRVPLPADLSQLLVSHAYLGQLDVNPLGGRRVGGQTIRKSWTFSAQQVESKGVLRLRIEGTSDVAGGQAQVGFRSDGRRWEHAIRLGWEGYIDLRDNRVQQLVVVARGFERLRWGNQQWKMKGDAVSFLPAGHPIDMKCAVRYGLIAKPVSESKAKKR